MQIRNDYTSFQNRNYPEGHVHHVTECLQEEQVKQKEGAFGAGREESGTKNGAVVFSKDGDTYRMSAGQATEQKRKEKAGGGIFKNFWDTLGEETSGEKQNTLNAWRNHLLSGLHGAAASIRETFPYQVVESVQSIPAKVKAVFQSVGAKLRRGGTAFAALTNGQTPSGKNSSGREKSGDDRIASAGRKDDIPMRVLIHSHLTDSYSRTGEYCQLSDNLTYGQRKSGGAMPESGAGKRGEETGGGEADGE